jgi:hypothetical protein
MPSFIFLRYEHFHFDPPDRQYSLNVPLMIVAFTLGCGFLTLVAMTAVICWRILHG